jgi:hypothetical protein
MANPKKDDTSASRAVIVLLAKFMENLYANHISSLPKHNDRQS